MVWGVKSPWKTEEGVVEGTDVSHSGPNEISSAGDHASSPTTGEKCKIAAEADELSRFEKTHQFDQNIPQDKLDEMRDALRTGDAEIIHEDALLIESSPYQEVRAAVRSTDGGEVANTIRAWVMGMLFVTVASGLNMFLSMRSPAISFSSVLVQLLVYPIGCGWAKVMPTHVFNTFGLRWTLNTGPFTIKEHVVITIMSNVSIGYAYSTDALLALKGKPFYNIDMGWGFQILFTLSSQLIGIGMAGMFRRFLVWPSAMIWPGQFSNTALFYALHDKSPSDPAKTNGWKISRYRWFVYLTTASFVYYWIPGVLWQGLSLFAWVTWIKPENVVVNQLFGGFTGLSLIPITFDWTYVSGYLGDPLLAPVYSLVNTLIGLFLFVIITTIGISYSGAWYSDYLPINTSSLFSNTGKTYNVTRILTPEYTFDLAKYLEYSPTFLAPTFIMNYGLSFAALTASIVHTALFNGKEIWNRAKAASLDEEEDIHQKLMRNYKECPDWWYGVLFVIAMAMGLATALGFPSQLPWWAFFVANIIALTFLIPTCMILATTNIGLALNVLSAFLAGYMIPGKPIGVMIFKVFSTITLGQAQTYSGDLKLGHYMKISPRILFWSQVIPTIWATFVQIAVMNWTLGNIEDVCTTTQKAHFTCPNGKTFFSSSIVWGVIGPNRILGKGSTYAAIQYMWLLGALLPVFFYVLMKLFPRSPARLLHAPIMLGAMGWLPPATPLSFSTWSIAGLIFNKYIRDKWHGWWSTYNYLTAAAIDSGLIISTVIIFFAITFPNVEIPQWWGNVGVFDTLDATNSAVRKKVAAGNTFGPATW